MTEAGGTSASFTPNYYDMLGVGKDATSEEIDSGFRKQSLKHHPDKNPDNIEEATRIFQDLQKARDVLKDPVKRSDYDKSLNAKPSNLRNAKPSEEASNQENPQWTYTRSSKQQPQGPSSKPMPSPQQDWIKKAHLKKDPNVSDLFSLYETLRSGSENNHTFSHSAKPDSDFEPFADKGSIHFNLSPEKFAAFEKFAKNWCKNHPEAVLTSSEGKIDIEFKKSSDTFDFLTAARAQGFYDKKDIERIDNFLKEQSELAQGNDSIPSHTPKAG